MHSDQLPYRQLHDQILSYTGDAVHDDLLLPWLREHDGERRWLGRLRARTGDPIPRIEQEELWRLYALSRIVQLLQLSFAPPTADAAWNLAPVSADEHARFMAALGLEPVQHAAFHPFYHEVVTVDQLPDAGAPPEIAAVYWPGYTLGALLVSRAGCRVQAGRTHLVKAVAEESTLYWAYARNGRPTEDRSNGWGSNSQWRTSFRRDYALDGALHFNVDAEPEPGRGPHLDQDLDAGERAELLRHRCFVTSTKRSGDRWPYGLSLTDVA